MKLLPQAHSAIVQFRRLLLMPHDSLDPLDKTHATHLAAISLGLLSITIISVTLQYLSSGSIDIQFSIVALVCTILFMTYLLSRTRHYRIGIMIGMIATLVAGLQTVLVYRTPLSTLMLIPSILVGSIFLRARMVLLIMTFNLVVITLLRNHPAFNWNYQINIINFFFFMIGSILALSVALRTRAEASLRTNEKRYRQMFHNNRAVQLLIDPRNGCIVDANPAAADFYGFSLNQLRNMSIQDINTLAEEDIRREMQQALTGEQTYFEFQHRLASGEIRDVDVFSGPVDMPEGQFLYSVVADVTGKRQADARREKLIDHLRFLNQTAMELIKLPDTESVYTYIGERLADLLPNAIIVINENSPDQVTMTVKSMYGLDQTWLGRIWKMIGFSPIDQTFVNRKDTNEIFGQGQLMKFENGFVSLAGDYIPPAIINQLSKLLHLHDVYLVGLQENGVLYAGVHIYTRSPNAIEHPDLIEAFIQQASTALQRLQATEMLRRSELRSRALFEQSNDAVLLVDMDGRHVDANQRACDMLGYRMEEILQLNVQDVSIVPEQSNGILQRLLQGEVVPPYERIFRRKDGSTLPVEVNVQVVWDKVGQPLHIQSVARDITERKQMENEIRERHDELDRFFTLALDLLCIADMDGRFLRVNKAWTSVLGYPSEMLEGQHFMDYVHPDDRQATLQAISTLNDQQTLLGFTNRYRTAEGDYRVIEWYSQPHGNLIYAAARDITDRKQMENEVRASEARFRAIVDGIPDLIFRIREDGVYLDYHAPDHNELFALPEQFLGRRISEVMPPDIAEMFMGLLKHTLHSGRITQHDYSLLIEGVERRFEMRIVPAGEDEVLAISRDVTELQQAYEQLEVARERLEFAVKTARLAWWEMEVDSGRVTFDPMKVLMLGYSPVDFDDSTYQTFTDLIHRDDLHATMEAMRHLLDGRSEVYAVDYRILGSDGKYHWLHDWGQKVHRDDGREVVRGFAIDISERKRLQAQELTIALERERTRLLAQFIQNATHEFKTPLSIINSSAYLMERADQREKRSMRVTQIENQVTRIARLVDMLLKMSLLESTDTLSQIPIQIGQILTVLCHRLPDDAHNRINYSCEKPDELPTVMGSPDHLMDAIQHLLDNAQRFTPDGGTVQVRVEQIHNQVMIEVADNGPGIPLEDQQRVFETFWREDKAHTTPGFGLGLPMARRIIELHNGNLILDSIPGEGTTLRIYLPVLESIGPVRLPVNGHA